MEQIITLGYDKTTVEKVTRFVDRNEYKRRQSPQGVKIDTRACGRNRRIAIVNQFKAWQ